MFIACSVREQGNSDMSVLGVFSFVLKIQSSGLPLVREKSGKFKVREKSGNFVLGQGNLRF